MCKFLAISVFLGLTLSFEAHSVEPGYSEALEYFVERDKNKAKATSKSFGVDSPANIIVNPSKWVFGIGFGELSDVEYMSFEAGMSFVQSRYFEQNLVFEYMRFNTKNLDVYKTGQIDNPYGNSLFLLHSVKLSSRSFFLSPELGAGVGRIFDEPLKGGVVALKTGLSYSNNWSHRFLFSASLYYRRHEYFKADLSDEGVGLTLKMGF